MKALLLFFLTILSFSLHLEAQNTAILINSTLYSPLYGDKDNMDTYDTFTIIVPNGGEFYYLGETINIRWSTTGGYSTYVNLYFSYNSGTTWTMIISDTENDGRAQWTATTASEHCLMWIKDHNDTSETGGDKSDGEFTIGETGFSKNKFAKPFKYTLNNSPNPFYGTTRITYSMARTGNASISIFDLAGRKIVDIHNGNLRAGKHVFYWNAKTKSAGTYICRFKAGNKVITRRMTLLR